MTNDLDIHLPGIRNGQSDAFTSWVKEAELPLRWSLRQMAREVDAESIVQDTLLRVFTFAPRFQPDGRPNALLRWACVTARNLAIAEWRRRSRNDPPSGPPDGSEALPESPSELRTAIEDCVEKLPDSPRAAIEARIQVSGGNEDAAARSASMSSNTFFQNIRRAHQRLRECLERKGYGLSIGA